jgi:hypothetical protein
MKKLFVRGLSMLVITGALVAMIMTAFWLGKLEGGLNPAWTTEKMMCVSQEVDIRESPTGYVIGTAPAGSALWFVKLDLPFAHVAYYDGSTWLEGTVTASWLELCK